MSSSSMSLARAFTKRSKREGSTGIPTREGSVRYAPGTISRGKISLPTELISTTNVQALNAPDIRLVSSGSSNSSIQSSDESEFSSITKTFLDSPMTSPDTSSIDLSPVVPDQPSHASFFDTKSSKRSVMSIGTVRSISSNSSSETPAIPHRALSHSKRAHVELAKKNSISRMSPPPNNISATTTRNSTDFFNGGIEAHPFGKELAQVNEVAEDFKGWSAAMDEDEEILLSRGLRKFAVEDYINEIQELWGGVFEDDLSTAKVATSQWI